MSRRSWRGFAVAAAAAAAALCGPFVGTASASHGRYLHVSWKQAPSDPNTVDFTVAANFRRGEYADDCVPSCSGSDGLPMPGDVVTEDVSGTELFFGDGQTTEELQFLVTAASATEDWIHVLALEPERPAGKIDTLIRHTYNGPGPWRAEVDTCCTIRELRNNADNDFRAATVVDLGVDQESSFSTMAPLIEVARGGTQRWRVSASDAGGEALLFRLATADEACASECEDPQPPGLTISAAGEVAWDTTGVGEGLWQTSVVIESLSGAGAVLSSSQVTYLIRVRAGAPPTAPPPATPPAPRAPQAACTLSVSRSRVPVGVPTTIRVRAFRVDGTAAAGVKVTMTGTGGVRRQQRVTDARGFATFRVTARRGNARISVAATGGCGARSLQSVRSSNCSGLTANPQTVRLGTTQVVAIRVRVGGRSMGGTIVRVTGAGVSASGRTDRRGVVRIRIRPTRAGVISITAPTVLSCRRAIGVRSGSVPFTG